MQFIPFKLQEVSFRNLMRMTKVGAGFINFPKPTLLTGPGSSGQLCDSVAQLGHRRVLIVTDDVLYKIGLIDPIIEALKANNVQAFVYSGVKPDPSFDQVKEGLAQLKSQGCDAVIAVGGGSSIDCSKVICAAATNNKDIKKLTGYFKVWKDPLPLYAIPTTAGTGSEVTAGAVVTDSEQNKKCMMIDPKVVPLVAALDGELMINIPAPITAATGMDALTHAIEAFLSANASPETDRYALAAARLIAENLEAAFKDGKNLEARQNMALASCYAGLAFTKANLGYVHAIAHRFGERYHVPHGKANAVVLPHVLEFSKDAVADRLALLADHCGIGNGGSDESKANAFIQFIRDLNGTFGIESTLAELKKSDMEEIAKDALFEAHFNFPVRKYMNQQQCVELLGAMLPAA